MDGYIVGSMISANSITGEQIQANSIKTANLELSVQKKIQDATNEETVKALIKADLDGFESTLSKEFVTVENAATQIQQATEVAVKEATQSIIDNAVSESMGAVDGQLNDKLNQYTSGTLLPAINEKAEEVLQNAEDYVVTKLESYATKQELSSSISQTREQIELSVSEKYTTKTESATIITEAIDGITVGAINRALGTGENKSFKFNGGANETWLPYKFSNDISDKEAYVSFNYTLTGTAQNGSQIEFAPSYLKKANNQTVYRPKHIFFTSNRLQDVNITDTVSFTTKDFQDISPSSTSYIRFVGNGFTGTLSVSEVQIKPGNSKTSWSPAPEDVNNDIVNAKNEAIISANNTLISTIANHYTKSETDSKISVAKDAINLGVSNKYETKANVETKVTSTLNSAKSYADTKKNEAISSANNTLNSTIANYYTKSQTDSAINVAKDAINLGVSQTYETKTNVESKINSIQIGGRNLLKGTSSSFKEFTMNEWNCLPYDYLLSDLGLKVGDKVAFKLYLKFGNTLCGGAARITFLDTAGTNIKSVNNAVSVKPNSEGYSEITTEIPANAVRIRVGAQRETAGNGLAHFNFQIKEPKLEQGTKCSTWSPAPEDVTADITNAKTDAINTAASDATNKANNAKNEAITSANNTLTTTIANYYTKAQTDSQIKVAKDSITQAVSSTYETKTNVTNKINGVNSSISSLQTRMNTAEQKITDTAITNTVKQNFYTKTETDGKVTTVQNSMNSSITQLSNQIATKVDVNGVLSTIQQNPNSIQIGFNKISNALTIDSTGMIAKAQNGNKYFQLGYNGMTMYNPANGTHQWGKVAAINNKFTVASNGNSSGLSLGHHVNENYVEDILCDSNGVVTVQRQMNHGGIYNNTYGQINIRQSGQGGWEITGRSDSQSIKPGGANQGAIGSNTQYVNQSWIANRYNPSSLEIKHLSHYVDDLECLKLVSEVQPARYFYKEYDEDGNDITTFTTKTSQLGLIYEDVRECSGRDLLTNEEDKAINSYGMVSVLWGAVRNLNERLNKLEYENALLNDELQNYKQKEGND